MAYLDSNGLQTLWTKIKITFAKNIGIAHGTDKVDVILKDGASTPAELVRGSINSATTTTAGVMSSDDKIKLNGIETEANKYIHPTTEGNKHIPAGGASGNILVWDSTGTAKWSEAPDTGVTKINAGSNVSVDRSTGEVTISATDTTYVFNTAYNATSNKAATMSDIQTAVTGSAKYKGTIANESAFIALTGYKVGDYYVANATFTHTVGDGTITVEAGNMIFCNTDYASAYSASHFDIVQADIEAIPDSVINALS